MTNTTMFNKMFRDAMDMLERIHKEAIQETSPHSRHHVQMDDPEVYFTMTFMLTSSLLSLKIYSSTLGHLPTRSSSIIDLHIHGSLPSLLRCSSTTESSNNFTT